MQIIINTTKSEVIDIQIDTDSITEYIEIQAITLESDKDSIKNDLPNYILDINDKQKSFRDIKIFRMNEFTKNVFKKIDLKKEDGEQWKIASLKQEIIDLKKIIARQNEAINSNK